MPLKEISLSPVRKENEAPPVRRRNAGRRVRFSLHSPGAPPLAVFEQTKFLNVDEHCKKLDERAKCHAERRWPPLVSDSPMQSSLATRGSKSTFYTEYQPDPEGFWGDVKKIAEKTFAAIGVAACVVMVVLVVILL